MAEYEIVQKFRVMADTPVEARRRVFPAVGRSYLRSETIKEIAAPKPKAGGWGKVLKAQLTGKGL
jgi:hypothetical protein